MDRDDHSPLLIFFLLTVQYLSAALFIIKSQKDIAVPERPALPVRPIRCTYVSGVSGKSKFITWVNSSISIPLAAISVASRIRSDFVFKAA